MIEGLHHNAYRCRDSAQTRAFYEDFLGLPLVEAFEIEVTKTGRQARVLHSFYQMADGSCLAFFEAPEQPFDFKEQHDFDLHIALRVDEQALQQMFAKAKSHKLPVRGISDHGFCRSLYLRDPNGYVIELAADTGQHSLSAQGTGRAQEVLQSWQETKSRATDFAADGA